eukprot:13213921-Alexandrium_andersonii.AAC.1
MDTEVSGLACKRTMKKTMWNYRQDGLAPGASAITRHSSPTRSSGRAECPPSPPRGRTHGFSHLPSPLLHRRPRPPPAEAVAPAVAQTAALAARAALGPIPFWRGMRRRLLQLYP